MTNVDDFEVAKAVADQLKDLDGERQARVLRWVSEVLGVSPVVQSSVSASQNVPPAGSATFTAAQSPSAGATNIKSFMEAKAPKSDNQFAAAVAYYYRFEAPLAQRRESITPEMLQEATRLSGRSRLGDPGKTLRNAKDMGYLDSSTRGEFAINSVGENLVAMTLPGQGSVAASKARKSGRAKKQKR